MRLRSTEEQGHQRRAVRPGRVFTLLPVLSLLAGCASYEPIPLEPAKELDALSRLSPADASRPEGPERPEAALDFSDGANDAELVAVALRLNQELRAKRLEVGEAEAFLVSAGLWPNPEVGFSWRGPLGDASGYTVDADLLFELLLPAERRARKDAALSRIDEARAQVVAAEWQLVSRVRAEWLSVLAAENYARLIARELALREEAVSLVRRRRELGEGTELDIAAAELELGRIQRDSRLAAASLESGRRQLNALLGLPPTLKLQLTASGAMLSPTVRDDVEDAELDRRLLEGRFELRALEAAYQAAEHSLRAAVARQYPHLKLGPSLSHEGTEGDYLGIGVALPIPLFDRNQGEIAERLVLRDKRRSEYVARLHALRAEAFEKNYELRRARSELEAQERVLLPLLNRAKGLFERAFEARDISVFEWATARERALEAERGHLEAVVRFERAAVELDAALGLPGAARSRGEKP
jgi:outer membrane protein TolC